MSTASCVWRRAALALGIGTLLLSMPGNAAAAAAGPWRVRVSPELLQVYDAATNAPTPGSSIPAPAGLQPGARLDTQGRVQVDVHVDCAPNGVTQALAAAGLSVGASVRTAPFCVVEGWAPPGVLPALAAVAHVTLIKVPAYAARKQPRWLAPATGASLLPPVATPRLSGASGSALPQATGAPTIDGNGITIMHAAQYVSTTGVNGAGVTVGVMSDDIASLAVIQSRGELPGVQNLTASGVLNPSPTDEGTMMLEEVHAVAPGAALAFCAPLTSVEYVSCLGSLIAAGATILVDDLAYLPEDMMSASSSFAQGVQSTLTQNPSIALFTVSENFNGSYWQGAYAPVSLASLGGSGFTCNSQTDAYIESFGGLNAQTLTVKASGSYPVTLQWADPFDQNVSNFDLYVKNTATDTTTCFAGAGATATLTGGDMSLTAGTYSLYIAAPDASLSGKFLKLLIGGDGATELNLPTAGSVVSPQAFLPGVTTLGAVSGADGIGDTIESFSGLGPISLMFPTPSSLQAPTLVAPDGIYVDAASTKFAADVGPGSLFYGTSAAAPNAAAVAALLRAAFPNLTPAQLTGALESGATPLAAVVPGGIYGYGRVDALGALGTIAAPRISGWNGAGPLTIVGGTSSPALPFNLTGTGNLQFSVRSTNAAVIPTAIAPAGSAGVRISPASCGTSTTACTATLTPAMGQVGAVTVQIYATDGAGRAASVSSAVTVVAPPAPTVTIASGGSQSLTPGGTPTPIMFTIAGTGSLSVTAATSNSSLVSGTSLSTGCGTTSKQCTATLTLASGQTGTASIALKSKDAYGQTGSATASVQVAAPGGGGGGSVDFGVLLALAGALCRRARAQPR